MTLPILSPARKRTTVLGRRKSDWNDMSSLQGEMNRVFDDFFSRMGVEPFRTMEPRYTSFCPSIDISETQKKIIITAELPGMEEKDISVDLAEDCLLLSGERKEEEMKEDEQYCCREMTYGSFQRTIPLNSKVDADKVEAKFKNGMLRITLPKLPAPEQKRGRKIEIKSR